jgi:cyclopropane-fatty-acyl-phospholipid synthase
VLRPGGLFLNHGITSSNGWQQTPATRFTNLYVFPDGQLTRMSNVAKAMEDAGFELLDIESLRRHYVLTLRHWIRRLEAAREQAVALSSDAVCRLWRLYMSGAAHFFDEGSLNIYQILAGHNGAPVPVPLRRDDLYRATWSA